VTVVPIAYLIINSFNIAFAARPAVQHLFQILPRIALTRGGDLLGRADRHHMAAGVAPVC